MKQKVKVSQTCSQGFSLLHIERGWEKAYCTHSAIYKREENWNRICPAINSGMVTMDAPVSHWPIGFSDTNNSPRRLCESQLGPVFLELVAAR